MTDDVPIWAQQLISKVDDMNVRLNGMQESIDGLRTILNTTCDRVTVIEKKNNV